MTCVDNSLCKVMITPCYQYVNLSLLGGLSLNINIDYTGLQFTKGFFNPRPKSGN